jgi:hypothetical protein
MLATIRSHAHRIRREVTMPRIKWDGAFGAAIEAPASAS